METPRSESARHHPTPDLRSDPPPRGEGGPSASADLVLLGEFGRAHGLRGEVRLKTYTGDPLAIASYGPLLSSKNPTSKNRAFTLKDVRPAPGPAPDMLIARVEGVSTREAAEALNRVELYVERDRLPPPDEEDEFLLADLIGLTARDAEGKPVGTVVDVPNYGGGDLLEIAQGPGGRTALLPFTKDFVPAVDIAGRSVTVALPDDFFAAPEAKPADAPGDGPGDGA
ncbi:ribosome maturation factor RimM [Microvirga sp. BT291]|nr:ribosome maturation factor RimM [Microvirga pudoricolor]